MDNKCKLKKGLERILDKISKRLFLLYEYNKQS